MKKRTADPSATLGMTKGRAALTSAPVNEGRTEKQQVPPLRYPGFPVELGGVGGLHAPFSTERRKRGCVQCCVAGNPATPVGMTILFGYRPPPPKTKLSTRAVNSRWRVKREITTATKALGGPFKPYFGLSGRRTCCFSAYSCRTAFVRLRGWSTSIPFWIANW